MYLVSADVGAAGASRRYEGDEPGGLYWKIIRRVQGWETTDSADLAVDIAIHGE